MFGPYIGKEKPTPEQSEVGLVEWKPEPPFPVKVEAVSLCELDAQLAVPHTNCTSVSSL
jgi:hypothetical protein